MPVSRGSLKCNTLYPYCGILSGCSKRRKRRQRREEGVERRVESSNGRLSHADVGRSPLLRCYVRRARCCLMLGQRECIPAGCRWERTLYLWFEKVVFNSPKRLIRSCNLYLPGGVGVIWAEWDSGRRQTSTVCVHCQSFYFEICRCVFVQQLHWCFLF